MDVFEAIQTRRSIKFFTAQPVPREVIERLLDAAVLAPNHRMTEPWGFLVLGERAKRAYATVLAGRKARRAADAKAAAAVHERVVRQTVAVPAILAVTVQLAEDPEVREEDYAATYMAVQNVLLAATARGLGTHVKTGAVMEDPELRAALDVSSDRRVIALIFVGEAAEVPAPKSRSPAAERTRWLP